MHVHTVGHSLRREVWCGQGKISEHIMLTSLDEYFSATALNGWSWIAVPGSGAWQFLSTHISQGSVVTHMRYDGMFNYHFV